MQSCYNINTFFQIRYLTKLHITVDGKLHICFEMQINIASSILQITYEGYTGRDDYEHIYIGR